MALSAYKNGDSSNKGMERSLQTLKKIFFAATFLVAGTVQVFAQTPSQKDKIRIQIWSELDAFPGKFTEDVQQEQIDQTETSEQKKSTDSDDGRDISIFNFAIARAKEISPYLLGGMLSGWEFDYVPYDKTRQVDEFFEITEIDPFNPQVNKIYYKEPAPVEDRLICWVECERTPVQKLAYERWSSIIHPKIKGHGSASVEDGFEGIKAACSAAVRDAVREYWRTLVKNKPKEILGRVLLIQDPRIYIYEGQYVVDLDFFVETDKIVSYSYY